MACTKILQDLSKQLGGTGGLKNLPVTPNNSQASMDPAIANTIAPLHQNGGSSNSTSGGGAVTFFSALNGDDVHPGLLAKKQAKVLFDYEATDPSEISVSANQVITVQIVPNDNDWVLAETGRDSGKIPKAYIQIVD